MISYKEYLTEGREIISWDAMKHVEQWADKIFNSLNMDVHFTKHFMERVNDFRNNPHITLGELQRIFKLVFEKYGNKIKFLKPKTEVILKDMATDINTPVAFEWNPVKRMMEMRALTIMRKKNFKASEPTLAVR